MLEIVWRSNLCGNKSASLSSHSLTTKYASCTVSLFDSKNMDLLFPNSIMQSPWNPDIFTTTIAPCAALCQVSFWDIYIRQIFGHFFQKSCLGTFNFSDNN